MKQLKAILLCTVSAITGTLLGTWLYTRLVTVPAAKTPETPPVSPNAAALQEEFSTAIRRAMPAVVSIAPEAGAKPAPDFRRLTGLQQSQAGYGTGFLISKDGFMVTTEAVVRNHEIFHIGTADGREYTAKFTGADPASGLAVLKISGRNDFPVLRFAKTIDLQPGQWVLAPGAGDGNRTVTAGILAGLPGSGTQLHNSILLTTAAAGHGNAGGPLIDTQCRVLGVNPGKTGTSGVSWAIAAEPAEKIIRELIRSGRIQRPWLGLSVSEQPGGIRVEQVAPHSPAADSMEPGDIILTAAGQPVRSVFELQEILMRTGAGNRLALSICRGNRSLSGSLQLGVSPVNWFRKLQSPAGISVLAL